MALTIPMSSLSLKGWNYIIQQQKNFNINRYLKANPKVDYFAHYNNLKGRKNYIKTKIRLYSITIATKKTEVFNFLIVKLSSLGMESICFFRKTPCVFLC